jgi:hypothetical protein
MGSRCPLLTELRGRYMPKSDWLDYAEIGTPGCADFWPDYAEIEMA